MAQITHGLRAVLSNPHLYSAFQSMMGAHRARRRIVSENIRPYPGMKILDIGCGPAEILSYLPDVEYWGVDISEPYIKKAKQNHLTRGHFYCKELTSDDIEEFPPFDVVLALGVLHHMDDETAGAVLRMARKALAVGGRLVTVDPCFDESQNAISRFLVRNDRGQNVRTKAKYTELAAGSFAKIVAEIHHRVWIPYTNCVMECSG